MHFINPILPSLFLHNGVQCLSVGNERVSEKEICCPSGEAVVPDIAPFADFRNPSKLVYAWTLFKVPFLNGDAVLVHHFSDRSTHYYYRLLHRIFLCKA